MTPHMSPDDLNYIERTALMEAFPVPQWNYSEVKHIVVRIAILDGFHEDKILAFAICDVVKWIHQCFEFL